MSIYIDHVNVMILVELGRWTSDDICLRLNRISIDRRVSVYEIVSLMTVLWGLSPSDADLHIVQKSTSIYID